MAQFLVIIPAYNEAETIASIINEIKKYVTDIVVIDDGSKDDTAKIAEKAGALVVSHVLNKGYGAAQRTGHIYAIRNNYDYVVQLDGDGQHLPKYLPKIIDLLKRGRYDLVIGSRFLTRSYKNYSAVRQSGIIFFTWLVNLSGTRITDVTSGYKGFKVSSLKKLSRGSDLHPAVEQMLQMNKLGFSIKEIPMIMPVRRVGESHLNIRRFIMYPYRALTSALKVLIYR